MIGANIKKYRIEAGLTQEQFAERLGYGRSTVTKWEIGSLEPLASTVKAIAQVLNIDVAKLYE